AGKFDILHLGHIAYLEQARELAGEDGELIVVIARDSTIVRERGAPPVFPQEQRRRLVQSLRVVDKAVIGYEDADPSRIVTEHRPDVIALGYDQRLDVEKLQQQLRSHGINVDVVRLEKRDADGLSSSTRIRKRIIEYYKNNGTVR
ncbi:MAG: adenylyltransferase/cytidyltransferase family protein, partial [Candidatus Thorarchaeota archaeon]